MNEKGVAAAIYESAVVWDMIWPWEPSLGNTWERLEDFATAGHTIVGVTIAGDNHTAGEALKLLSAARNRILAQPERFVLIESVDDVLRAKATRRLGIELHFEGTNCLDRDLTLIETFYKLGIRHTLLAFNLGNAVAGGCFERSDGGLTKFGIKVVREMERVGMLLDLSHVGERSSLEAMEIATKPVVFSHSNARALRDTLRNVSDQQAKQCARLGGLIGISGSSEYLGDPQCSSRTMLGHIRHLAELIGPEHVGIGFDVVFDQVSLTRWARGRPEEWPMTLDPQWPGFTYAMPGQLFELADLLLKDGFTETQVRGILGENYIRICRAVWQPAR